jgi:integrase
MAPQLVAKLLYGSGLGIMEAVRLRVKDIDFQMKQLTVRSGKGDKDRLTTFPATIIPLLQNHLAGIKTLHQQDLAQGHGESICPMRWLGSLRIPPRNGAGSTSSPPETSPSTRVPVSPIAIMLTPASSTKPSRWPFAVPV